MLLLHWTCMKVLIYQITEKDRDSPWGLPCQIDCHCWQIARDYLQEWPVRKIIRRSSVKEQSFSFHITNTCCMQYSVPTHVDLLVQMNYHLMVWRTSLGFHWRHPLSPSGQKMHWGNSMTKGWVVCLNRRSWLTLMLLLSLRLSSLAESLFDKPSCNKRYLHQ